MAHLVALPASLRLLGTVRLGVTILSAARTRDVPATFSAAAASIIFVVFTSSTIAASTSSSASAIPAVAFVVRRGSLALVCFSVGSMSLADLQLFVGAILLEICLDVL